MQVVDSLAQGGTERFAANLANTLANRGHESHLCTTRREGPLAAILQDNVQRLHLNRSRAFDPAAVLALGRYLTRRRIEVVHAHSSSVFISLLGVVASATMPRIVWHLHQGRLAEVAPAPLLMRLAAKRVAAVIAVSRPLADWAIERLGLPSDRVNYVPNYVRPPDPSRGEVNLPGEPGFRIVSVGNIRPEKDTLTLLKAMSHVVAHLPQAHLILVGGYSDEGYRDLVRQTVEKSKLTGKVSFLGQRNDVPKLLPLCDVGVISSLAEGFPLALLEYGTAGLATVSTRVGACEEILDNGRLGLLVPTSAPGRLASAILHLLTSKDKRAHLGAIFQSSVKERYGENKAVDSITSIYRQITVARNRPH